MCSTNNLNKDTKKRLSGPALDVFLQIAVAWGLTRAQQRILIGSAPASILEDYESGRICSTLTFDNLTRISHLIGIFEALAVLVPLQEVANDWVHRPNNAALFNGCSALDYMLRGQIDEIAAVRRYLDGQL